MKKTCAFLFFAPLGTIQLCAGQEPFPFKDTGQPIIQESVESICNDAKIYLATQSASIKGSAELTTDVFSILFAKLINYREQLRSATTGVGSLTKKKFQKMRKELTTLIADTTKKILGAESNLIDPLLNAAKVARGEVEAQMRKKSVTAADLTETLRKLEEQEKLLAEHLLAIENIAMLAQKDTHLQHYIDQFSSMLEIIRGTKKRVTDLVN